MKLLNKIQFKHNAEWLDTIDMEKYDDDVRFYIVKIKREISKFCYW